MADSNSLPAPEDNDGVEHESGWWTALRRVADAVLCPCTPALLFLGCKCGSPAVGCVTGTFLCRPHESGRRVTLCLQDGGPAAPPLVVLDLPIGTRELSEAGRIALECERCWAGASPVVEAPSWAVRCCGRRAGFGGPRLTTGAEARVLEALRVVTTGAGRLRSGEGSGGEWFAYMRGSFERVVGSGGSESYHLVDPSGSLGLELSLFFFSA